MSDFDFCGEKNPDFSHRGNCVGLVVENGYMFEMDSDMSSFPVITWHCPKLRSLLIKKQEHNEYLSSGEPKPIFSNIGKYWLRVTTG